MRKASEYGAMDICAGIPEKFARRGCESWQATASARDVVRYGPCCCRSACAGNLVGHLYQQACEQPLLRSDPMCRGTAEGSGLSPPPSLLASLARRTHIERHEAAV